MPLLCSSEAPKAAMLTMLVNLLNQHVKVASRDTGHQENVDSIPTWQAWKTGNSSVGHIPTAALGKR